MNTSLYSLERVFPEQMHHFRAQLEAFDLPTADLNPEQACYYFFQHGPETLGTAGLEIYGTMGLLRSVSIAWSHQGKGLGEQLTQLLFRQAKTLGIEDLYLLTTTAEAFFAKRGFSVVERGVVPAEIKQTEEFRTLCADTATVMHYPLSVWRESDSRFFLQFANELVPERPYQQQVVLDLLRAQTHCHHLTELCCGAGDLSAAILEAFPGIQVLAMDGSPEMLQETARTLLPFQDRVELMQFQLEREGWQQNLETDAFVSSLAIHHLDGPGKQQLFQDLYRMLRPGGIFVLIDLVQHTRRIAEQISARSWDDWVKTACAPRLEVFRRFKEEGWNFYDDPAVDPIDQPDTLSDLFSWLAAAGFVDVDLAWMRAGHVILFGWKEKNH